MHEFQDDAIIQDVLQGNKNAYAILIERYQHFVFTLIYRMVNSQEDAEELAQDTFIKAFHSLSAYNGKSKFSTWLYTIARNTTLSFLRVNKHVYVPHERELENTKDEQNASERKIESKTKKELINNAIKKLKNEEAQVLTLFYINEQTIEEICSILDMTNNNAKVKLFRARKKLKEVLERDYKTEFEEYKG